MSSQQEPLITAEEAANSESQKPVDCLSTVCPLNENELGIVPVRYALNSFLTEDSVESWLQKLKPETQAPFQDHATLLSPTEFETRHYTLRQLRDGFVYVYACYENDEGLVSQLDEYSLHDGLLYPVTRGGEGDNGETATTAQTGEPWLRYQKDARLQLAYSEVQWSWKHYLHMSEEETARERWMQSLDLEKYCQTLAEPHTIKGRELGEWVDDILAMKDVDPQTQVDPDLFAGTCIPTSSDPEDGDIPCVPVRKGNHYFDNEDDHSNALAFALHDPLADIYDLRISLEIAHDKYQEWEDENKYKKLSADTAWRTCSSVFDEKALKDLGISDDEELDRYLEDFTKYAELWIINNRKPDDLSVAELRAKYWQQYADADDKKQAQHPQQVVHLTQKIVEREFERITREFENKYKKLPTEEQAQAWSACFAEESVEQEDKADNPDKEQQTLPTQEQAAETWFKLARWRNALHWDDMQAFRKNWETEQSVWLERIEVIQKDLTDYLETGWIDPATPSAIGHDSDLEEHLVNLITMCHNIVTVLLQDNSGSALAWLEKDYESGQPKTLLSQALYVFSPELKVEMLDAENVYDKLADAGEINAFWGAAGGLYAVLSHETVKSFKWYQRFSAKARSGFDRSLRIIKSPHLVAAFEQLANSYAQVLTVAASGKVPRAIYHVLSFGGEIELNGQYPAKLDEWFEGGQKGKKPSPFYLKNGNEIKTFYRDGGGMLAFGAVLLNMVNTASILTEALEKRGFLSPGDKQSLAYNALYTLNASAEIWKNLAWVRIENLSKEFKSGPANISQLPKKQLVKIYNFTPAQAKDAGVFAKRLTIASAFYIVAAGMEFLQLFDEIHESTNSAELSALRFKQASIGVMGAGYLTNIAAHKLLTSGVVSVTGFSGTLVLATIKYLPIVIGLATVAYFAGGMRASFFKTTAIENWLIQSIWGKKAIYNPDETDYSKEHQAYRAIVMAPSCYIQPSIDENGKPNLGDPYGMRVSRVTGHWLQIHLPVALSGHDITIQLAAGRERGYPAGNPLARGYWLSGDDFPNQSAIDEAIRQGNYGIHKPDITELTAQNDDIDEQGRIWHCWLPATQYSDELELKVTYPKELFAHDDEGAVQEELERYRFAVPVQAKDEQNLEPKGLVKEPVVHNNAMMIDKAAAAFCMISIPDERSIA